LAPCLIRDSTKYQKRFSNAVFFLRRQQQILANMTLVARRKMHFRVFWGSFLHAELLQKEMFKVHIKSLCWSIVTKDFSFPKKKSKLE